MTSYEPVIGLEIHAELLTDSKMFCGCEVVDTTVTAPNIATCVVCTAQPGALPVVNREAVTYAMRVGLALNCTINTFNQFDRKSYFYPDLPKGYQITQYGHPIAADGWLEIEVGGQTKRIGIRRAHMEEDTGKSIHVGGYSLVDLNRAGVPLLEIVTEPDFRSVEELEVFARKLRAILVYLGVNHGDMSKGVLRFEANVSVRPTGAEVLGTRTEIKNLNSIRSMVRASAYEIERQSALLAAGGEVQQQTMGFNETTGETFTQRIKETADDYRYFPEPDLPPLIIEEAWVDEVRASLPELPDAKKARFIEAHGIKDEDAETLVGDLAVADYFDAAVAAGGAPQTTANWITGELFREMNDNNLTVDALNVPPEALVALIGLVDADTINNNTAKKVLKIMLEEGGVPGAIVEARGLAQISDEGALEAIVDRILEENPENVATYLGGKEGLFGWFVGQVMRETRGKANAALVNDLLAEKFEARRE
ncbi:MAG: Asp-tRNA(Asn)/Glu-tRNA(Gln) amidotransferase subunit GatB [Anaerolineae bacterium]